MVLKIRIIVNILNSTTAQNKKTGIIAGVVVFIVVAVLIGVFIGGSNALGVVLGVIVFAAIAVGTLFVLKKVDDVPEAFE
jgi:Flp pilus assembly protein TadB